jgi:uracil-DNA glycosylase
MHKLADIPNTLIEEGWRSVLHSQFHEGYFNELILFLQKEKASGYHIYPDDSKIFAAFNLTPFHEVKVVIIGQDPYHGINQANGLCFSVPESVKIPPSLINIFKELTTDMVIPKPDHGDLTMWARQGVLLLNETLTVRAKQANSHKNIGWDKFTDHCINKINFYHSGIVYLLWGNYAISKETLIDKAKNFVLKAAHPSPLSSYRGFIGCKHFSKTNELLINQNKKPIDWSLSF